MKTDKILQKTEAVMQVFSCMIMPFHALLIYAVLLTLAWKQIYEEDTGLPSSSQCKNRLLLLMCNIFPRSFRHIFSIQFTSLQVPPETKLVDERRHFPMVCSEKISTKQVPPSFSAKLMSHRVTFPNRPQSLTLFTCTSRSHLCGQHE